MQSFLQFICEARRNPHLNPKISIYKALEPYKDDPDMYISYVDDVGKEHSKKTFLDKDSRERGKGKASLDRNISGFKLGINPKSTFNTPNGLYTYPLKEAWKAYASEKEQTLNVPFGNDRPTVYLVKATPKSNLKIKELSEYTAKDLEEDYKKMANIIVQHFSEDGQYQYGWEFAKTVLETAQEKAKVQTDGGKFWNMSRYTFFVLYGQIVSAAMKQEHKKELIDMVKHPNRKVDFSDKTIRFEKAQLSSSKPNTKNTTKWNVLFRELGYGGITDKKARGIIHDHEPVQAVFFTSESYEIIDSFPNKAYKDNTLEDSLQFSTNSGGSAKLGDDYDMSENDLLKAMMYAGDTPNLFSGLVFIRPLIVSHLMHVWKTDVAYIPTMSDENKKHLNYLEMIVASGNNSLKINFQIEFKNSKNKTMIEFNRSGIEFRADTSSNKINLSWADLSDKDEREKVKEWIKNHS